MASTTRLRPRSKDGSATLAAKRRDTSLRSSRTRTAGGAAERGGGVVRSSTYLAAGACLGGRRRVHV